MTVGTYTLVEVVAGGGREGGRVMTVGTYALVEVVGGGIVMTVETYELGGRVGVVSGEVDALAGSCALVRMLVCRFARMDAT